jgi:hypothetical protein
VAAATKKEFGFMGDVYTIDNGQYQEKIKRQQGIELPDDVVITNADIFGVADRIFTIEGNTWPLPVPLNSMDFVSAFIDAGHDFGDCHLDWISAKKTADIVVFHDYDSSHPGVVTTVELAANDLEWWLVHLSHHTAILERKQPTYGENLRVLGEQIQR